MEVQEKIDRSQQPGPDPAPEFAFPPYERFTLANGLKVFLVRDPRPVITFRLLFRGGSGCDGDLPGLADAVADQLTKGTSTLSAHEFARKIDFVGGSISPNSSPDALIVSAGGLRRHLPTILELFASAVREPAFSDEELEKYRQEQITSLKAAKAQPEFLANHAVHRVLYGQTTYGAMQTEEALQRMTPEMLRSYHDAWVVPANGSLAVVGNFSRAELEEIIEGAFGDWKTAEPVRPEPPQFPERRGRRMILIDRPTSVQSSIRVVARGPLTGSPDRPKTYILNSILGAGTGLGNRLAMNLRETNAFTYTPYSYFDVNLYGGSFVAGADVRNEVTGAAVREMLHEIRRMQQEPVPSEELDRNIQSAVGNFLLSIADPGTTAMRVQSIDFYNLPEDYYNRLVPAYMSTNAEEIQSMADRYLDADDLAIVVVGRAADIQSDLEQFGPPELWDTELEPVRPVTAEEAVDDVKTWERLLAALGGKDRLRAVRSIRLAGTVTLSVSGQTMTGAIERIQAQPNRLYQAINVMGMKQQVYNDGREIAYVQMGTVDRISGDTLARELESSQMLPEAYLEETGAKVRGLGHRRVNGKDTICLELLYPKGGETTYYLDPESALPVVTEVLEKGTTYYADWRSIDGLMLPHEITIEPQLGLSLEIGEIEYQLDVPVEEERFRLEE